MQLDFVAPLFVPSHRPERFEKAAQSGADAVILDLEDAVGPNDKLLARESLSSSFCDMPVLVRINAVGTRWHIEDVEAVVSSGFAGVMIPKADGSAHFADAVERISQHCPVIALVESAVGLAAARSIAALHGVKRLAFGSFDYCADLGCEHVAPALLSARNELVLASRLAGKTAPIDGVTGKVDDDDLVATDAAYARSLGFGGKLLIHPKQVAPAKAAFVPSAEELAWARRVLDSGDAAAMVDGAMVDEPVRIRARALIARSSR